MASSARAPVRTAGLRPLGLPRPAHVEVGSNGLPARVALGSGARGARGASSARGASGARGASVAGAWLEVEQVEEVWRIGEAWWRETPIGRTYYRVIVDGGRTVTLFRDELAIAPPRALEASSAFEAATSMWFEQHY